LAGQPLLSNNSKWLNFLLVKNRNWFFENVVLLGDALHTAHFSIGSGTSWRWKMRLHSSIALKRRRVSAMRSRNSMQRGSGDRGVSSGCAGKHDVV